MKCLGFAIVRKRVDVTTGEKVLKSIFPPIVKSAFAWRAVGIVQRGKEPIPNGQVGKILGVVPVLVVHAVRLGSLYEVTDPARRSDIPVVEKFGNRGQERVVSGGVNIAAEQSVNDCTAEDRIE